MSQGAYGINIPANVNISQDVKILCKKVTSLDTQNTNFEEQEGVELTQVVDNNNIKIDGLYNLLLPKTFCDEKGIYYIYIIPKEFETSILTIGTLAAYPSVRGIVISTNNLPSSELAQDNALVGYRIIYRDMSDSTKKMDYYRIITSSFKVTPVVENFSNSTTVETRYSYNANSNLLFLTVTPSVAPNFKSDATPFIGNASQDISIVNTKFSPILIELELVENDADTLAIITNGSQIRDLDNGVITTLTNDNQIYSQHEMTTLKDSATGKPIFEIRKKLTNVVDNGYDDIIQNYIKQ